MDDVYAINATKTELREGYNTGDVNRVLAVFAEDMVDCSDGRISGFGEGGRKALRDCLQDLFAKNNVRLVPIIIDVKVMGDMAVDYGWHELTLTPKSGGQPVMTRTRYLEIWKRDKGSHWKLAMFMDNADVPDQFVLAQAG